jgi:hypothetical protein
MVCGFWLFYIFITGIFFKVFGAKYAFYIENWLSVHNLLIAINH